ncbi:MAG: hypothetical protein HBSAPP03_01090 [Phycisphaerae bacterium]|nr:MAG: hypothetical protein HBSAPP03_01090 [Phycisphaerae bacterium]
MLAAVVLLAARAAAQDASPSDTPLKGPQIPREVAVTLVERDARGNFRRVEGRPEEAAAAKVLVEDAERERVREVGTARATAIGVFLIEHADRVREVADATLAGERDRASDMVRELWREFEPGEPEMPLVAPLASVMTEAQQAEIRRLVEEYWAAWIDWELRNARDKSDAARQRTRARLAFTLFQEEVRQAYERVIKPYADRIEALYAALDPTPEQRDAIKAVVIAFVRESKTRPTREQRHEVLTAIYRVLDDERRVKFFDLVARQASE